MTDITGIRLTISVLTLVGSTLSAIGAGFICLCYLFLPLKAHFRHRLIQNLALADFLNAVSTSSSGFYILARNRELPDGVGCRVNGLITQITVQATDLSILAIAIATVWAITRPQTFGMWSTRKGIIAVCFIWVLPFATGFTALAKGWYHPVSGNWCWIQKKPAYLRYALTHGWRFLVIISVVLLYAYLQVFLHRHYSDLRGEGGDSKASIRSRIQQIHVQFCRSTSVHDHDRNEEEDDRRAPAENHDNFDSTTRLAQDANARVRVTMGVTGDHDHHRHHRRQASDRSGLTTAAILSTAATKKSFHYSDYGRKVSKILLMRAYPTFYVILWIPGIANRLVEASGGSSRALQLMQASTQFVGLANAVTYGWNERILVQLRRRFGSRGVEQRKASEAEFV